MKLAEALSVVQKAPRDGPPFPVLLACGFTPLHMTTFLGAHLQKVLPGRKVEIQTGLYGSVAETLQRLSACGSEAAVLLLEWSELDARLGYRSLGGWGNANYSGILESVERTLARAEQGILRKPAALRLVVSLPTLDLPPGFHTVGWQASAAELALESVLSGFAERIASAPSVFVVSRQRLAVTSAAHERYDFRGDLNAGFPYTIKHSDALAEAVAGLVVWRASKKGLISDLDGTLWRGIVGEDGPEGVAWDLAEHAQVHGLYQQMLQSLAEQGVLIGIASKNDAATAEKALQRQDCVLKRERIFPAEIHWSAKSGSVSQILKTWNIGADSAVFVDDSPMELEEVRAAHPGIECILFPKNDYAAAFGLLQRLRDLFGKPALSSEDAFRLNSIRRSQQFLEQTGSDTLAEQFLSGAEARITFELDPPATDTRILELVNKTNQFNLNGRRFTEAEWQQMTCGADAFVAAIAYEDKFGPLGKIAVVAGRENGSTLILDTWVMSCRAFSRRIEYQILRQFFERTGAEQVQFEYTATTKNGPTQDFLMSLREPGDLGSGASVTRTEFEAKCPPLYHQVKFEHKDRKSWTTQKSA